jgi:hypothetical protein
MFFDFTGTAHAETNEDVEKKRQEKRTASRHYLWPAWNQFGINLSDGLRRFAMERQDFAGSGGRAIFPLVVFDPEV